MSEKKKSSRRSAAPLPAAPTDADQNASPAQQQQQQDNGAGADDHDSAPTPTRAPVAVGRSLEISCTPDVCMELLVDKLKLLDYERDFCKKKKPHRTPLSRLYFAVPDSNNNQSQQFFYFTGLATWLLGLAGVELPTPKEFDDPNITCSGILGGCKKLGFAPPNYHASKLTVGHGKEICGVLDGLADYALERRNFSFRKPIYLPDSYADDGEVEDDGVDDEADAAIEFPKPKYLEEEEEDAYMMAGGPADELAGLGPTPFGGKQKVQPSAAALAAQEKQMLQSKIDPTAWKLEVERVGPRLRIMLNADAKDWRSHLEEVQEHSKAISTAWPEGHKVLEKLRAELNTSLDKLTTRERFLNDQFEQLMSHYKAARQQHVTVQGTYNGRTEAISDRNNELHRITEQLGEMKEMTDEKASAISNDTAVVRIKNAIKKLVEELQEIEVRIGVVSHTLLQNSLKTKRALQAAAATPSDDDDDP